MMGPLAPSVLSLRLGEAKDILFFILFWRRRSACFSLDLEVCLVLDLLSTELFLVLAVQRALLFFL